MGVWGFSGGSAVLGASRGWAAAMAHRRCLAGGRCRQAGWQVQAGRVGQERALPSGTVAAQAAVRRSDPTGRPKRAGAAAAAATQAGGPPPPVGRHHASRASVAASGRHLHVHAARVQGKAGTHPACQKSRSRRRQSRLPVRRRRQAPLPQPASAAAAAAAPAAAAGPAAAAAASAAAAAVAGPPHP